MSDNSRIEWTDASWPVTVGCDHVSTGCDHCYAARLASGRLAHQTAYAGLAENGKFNGTVRCLPDRLDWPLRWRKPRRIFVCSMSDLFHEAVPDDFIARVFSTMAAAPQHTFQVLTKRHARMRSLLSNQEFATTVTNWAMDAMRAHGLKGIVPQEEWPLPNVWAGVSAEDQPWAEIRIHALLATPAAVRWVSAEPLLGPIDLRNLKARNGALIDALCGDVKTPGGEIYAACPGSVDWVVAGGESGPQARPMHPQWARSLRDQCQSARVPFLFKQWGEWTPYRSVLDEMSRPVHSWEDELGPGGGNTRVCRLGKKAAGRLLDGRIWDEYPRTWPAVSA